MANYYNEKNMNTFTNALADYRQRIANGEKFPVSISASNTKMGNVTSVSLLPYITCPFKCPECYAAKLAVLRPSVRNAYAKNTAIAFEDPETYWKEINKAAAAVRFFRFHVSGDITNAAYFVGMVETALNNPHTEFLAFTKRYSIVNRYIDICGDLPKNLHIIFSAWDGLEMPNPYKMPVAQVVRPGQDPAEDWKICGGNCFECACRGVGCWQLNKGETIAFNLH